MNEMTFVYAVKNKETGEFLNKSTGGRLYARLSDAKRRMGKNLGNKYEIVTYRLLELKGENVKEI